MSSGPPRIIQRNMVPVLARMFNNPEFSNLKLLVNDDTFYAEKNFLRVSSLVWEVLLGSLPNTHRMIEYRIERIRNSESILTMLKFVYGVPINFTRLPDLVLLEVVGLADMLMYGEFHKDLLAYVEKNRPHLIGAELPPLEGDQVEGNGAQVERNGEEVVRNNMQVEEISSEYVESSGGGGGQVVESGERVVGGDGMQVEEIVGIEYIERIRRLDKRRSDIQVEEIGSELVEASGGHVEGTVQENIRDREQVEQRSELQTNDNNSETSQVTRELENVNLNSDE